MKKTLKKINKFLFALVMLLSISFVNAQVSDAILTAEVNNGNNNEASEIGTANWKTFENNVAKLLPASTTYPQVYLDVTVNGSTITIVPDYLVLQNGKYKVVDAKASSLIDLSKMGTPDLTSRLTANQKIAYPAINAGSIIAKVKSSRTNLSGTTTLAVSTITLDIGVDFYVNVPKAQYTSATKRTLK